VIDTQGKLIGIATGVLSRIAPLAIPAATVDRVTKELLARGKVAQAWLGVAVQAVPIPGSLADAAKSASHGLLIVSANAESPAGKAGLLIGDILLSIAGNAVADPMDLRAALAEQAAGKKVTVSLLRGGEPKQLEVTLGERNERAR
jgi:S1-C subfamily serine protease